MKREYVIAGIVAASIVAGAGMATAQGKQGHGRGMGPMMPEFSELDANGDGNLTQAEMEAHAKAKFDAADTDGNGKLSAEELLEAGKKRKEERRAKRAEKMLKRLDTNNDGEVSFDEMPGQQTQADRMFSRIDADGDGNITEAEMQDAAKKFKERRGKHGKHGKPGKHGHKDGHKGERKAD
ncbi:EF-hand domain-containing protein [Rhodobacteraceae bacterium D3-12]|nr:EF-hand domain-containing protein [Rhodobacteraceae bacterium D3-12]